MSVAMRHPVGPFTTADWFALPDPQDLSRVELLCGNFVVTR